MDHDGAGIALNDVLTDPDTVAGLQKEGPVHRATLPNGAPVWLVVGHNEVIAALNDDRLSAAAAVQSAQGVDGGTLSPDMRDALLKSLTNIDPPDHTRLRRLVSSAFTARRVEAMRSWISRLTDELIDGFPRDEVDLMSQFAAPLPILVITELLGVPEADRPQVRAWSRMIQSGFGLPDFPVQAATDFVEYLRGLVAQRREEPDGALISGLIRARDENDALTENELTSTIFLMILAGHDTTVSLIGNGMYLLMREPDRAVRLREDPSLLPAMIDEFLRLESPVPVASFRAAADSFDIGSAHISAGDLVVISLQAANRDHAKFPDPARFDPARTNGRHLAFGHGMHYCLGAPLARMEGELAIGTLLNRFPRLRLAVPAAELTWSQAPFIHRLDRLPLLLT